MFEVEIKAQCDDLDIMLALLLNKGAKPMGGREQRDIYFAHPCRDFGKTDEALRLRFENEQWTLFYKGPKLDKVTKTREEIASPLSDVGSFQLILRRLGFKEVGRVEKVRRIYSYKGVEVSLDQVNGLGSFVEIEEMSDDLEKGRGEVLHVMKELGLEKSERRSYLELIIEKEKS